MVKTHVRRIWREVIQDRGKVRSRKTGALSTILDAATSDTVFSGTGPTGIAFSRMSSVPAAASCCPRWAKSEHQS